MDHPGARASRRGDALSRERIATAAIDILDADVSGDGRALTLRVLMARLSTGSGAIYHHVANMDQLRALAADEVLRTPLEEVAGGLTPDDALLAIASAIFDAIQSHPWVGAQLARSPVQPAVVRIWKSIGVQLEQLGLRGSAAASAGSTLTSFILGSVAQHSGRAPRLADAHGRKAELDAMAREISAMDRDPLVKDIAEQLRDHDDRAQFLDGVRIILTGIAASQTGRSPSAGR